MIVSDKESFVVIFGSVARGDFNAESDIDVMLYNYPEDKARGKIISLNLPNFPINFVCYDRETFSKFYNEGSLFFYHMFKQGFLVDGDKEIWDFLCEQFSLKKSFHDELRKISYEASSYKNLSYFNGYYLSALVNIYPLLKNFCIFTLAQQGVYEFNKKKCILTSLGDDVKAKRLLLLQQFYDYSVRNLDVKLNISPNSLSAKLLIEDSYNFIRSYNDKW